MLRSFHSRLIVFGPSPSIFISGTSPAGTLAATSSKTVLLPVSMYSSMICWLALADAFDVAELPLLHALFQIDVRLADDPADLLKRDDLEDVLPVELHQRGERVEQVGEFLVEGHARGS